MCWCVGETKIERNRAVYGIMAKGNKSIAITSHRQSLKHYANESRGLTRKKNGYQKSEKRAGRENSIIQWY